MNKIILTRNNDALATEPAALPSFGLSKADITILEALKDKKIQYLSEKGLTDFVKDLLSSAALRLGHKNNYADERERAVVMDMIAKDLRQKFYLLSTAEVKLAWEMGLNGDFKKSDSEIIVVSPAFLVKCLTAYKNLVKPETIKKHALYQKNADTKPVPTLPEQLAFFKKIFLLDFYEVKAKLPNYDFRDTGNCFYHRLTDLGLLSLTDTRKKAIYEQIKLENKRYSENELIKACKDKALKDYFIYLIGTGIEVENLLDEAIENALM